MTIYIQDNHPAIDILKNEGITNIKPASEIGDQEVITIALGNLMDNIVETETQFTRSLSASNRDILLSPHTPTKRLEAAQITVNNTAEIVESGSKEDLIKLEKAYHRTQFQKPLSDIKNDPSIDAIILTGFGKYKAPLQQQTDPNDRESGVDFYDEFTGVLDDVREKNTPTLATCWAAHASLNYFYGIERKRKPEKLTGVFDLQVTQKDSPLMERLGDSFPSPISRYCYSDEAAIQAEPNLIPLAGSKETGTALAEEKNGSVVYSSVHPEYLKDTLKLENERDIKNMGKDNAPIPENYDLQNPKRTWDTVNTVFFSNFAEAAYNHHKAKAEAVSELEQQQITHIMQFQSDSLTGMIGQP